MYGEGVTEEREGAPLALPLAGSGDGSGSGGSGGGGDVPLSSLVVTVPGSSALVYFFSDAGVAGKGFNVTYWWVWLLYLVVITVGYTGGCGYYTGYWWVWLLYWVLVGVVICHVTSSCVLYNSRTH